MKLHQNQMPFCRRTPEVSMIGRGFAFIKVLLRDFLPIVRPNQGGLGVLSVIAVLCDGRFIVLGQAKIPGVGG
ncbi:hypothetical protein C0081_12410 [Cohaesibacter celericrescens]|uniref:Uncharacterized protein n=1 Tax=Cohaesibacter celericrescens TaxID=2067669 RepID=A0A2N5XQW0_9HYPH|nr:hypothetical protein C0081_12410 [Cohaesibacter celericrescens]